MEAAERKEMDDLFVQGVVSEELTKQQMSLLKLTQPILQARNRVCAQCALKAPQFKGEKYIGTIKRIHTGFDGETRYQSGWHEVFGEGIKIVHYIDPYHLNKYITVHYQYITRAFSKQTKAPKS